MIQGGLDIWGFGDLGRGLGVSTLLPSSQGKSIDSDFQHEQY